ncbi:Kae1-associated serine/threonine protein kinase [Candidatus Thorarchaeota archaeon]|nr:MAG: Kae1-associated serine/threonine protein kinase [Candidatus Thorarchaeota archaeon]
MEEIIARGAESIILKTERWNRIFVLKWRQSKPYLFRDIDSQLRKTRTSRECKMLSVARALGVSTPAVYAVDLDDYTILMDYIEGSQFKQIANSLPKNQLKKFCSEFGTSIALLHQGDVVHGDPTTSNVIIDSKSKLWLVDFGLSEMNATVEMKGVDLHLIHRALETTHWDLQECMLEATIKGYSDTIGEEAKDALARMEEIRERGRYH